MIRKKNSCCQSISRVNSDIEDDTTSRLAESIISIPMQTYDN
jgi:hypothetical protein